MESEIESPLGICHECSTKYADSSQKPVYHCDLCEKWFCKEHLEPKYPYFVDWDTVFDVQGDPRIKASFYTEYRREGGHPDFVYLQKAIKEFQLEEKIRDLLIARAIDKMIEADHTRRQEKREKEWEERAAYDRAAETTTTTRNKYGLRFVVPLEVYSLPEYREYLNYAQTEKSVNRIVNEYYSKYGRKKLETLARAHLHEEWKEPKKNDFEEPRKKKHWWSKS